MVKQKQTLKLNQISSGIVTEASPLSQPIGSSQDEYNMSVLNDGTRRRRLGMVQESSGVLLEIPSNVGSKSGYGTFEWDLSDFSTGLVLTVVQIGNVLEFFSTEADTTISTSKVASLALSTTLTPNTFSFAQVDEFLVVATGKSVIRIQVTSFDSISLDYSEVKLEVRDQFGITDEVNGVLIDRGNDINYRPRREEITHIHLYNLHNQGWPSEEVWCYAEDDKSDKVLATPVNFAALYLSGDYSWGNIFDDPYNPTDPNKVDSYTGGMWPSNGDNYNLFIGSGSDEKPYGVEAFSPENMLTGSKLNTGSAKGKFIIDVFERGTSRMSSLKNTSLSLPYDQSPKQVKAVAEFAGRVFYAGFSSSVNNGDDRSPRLGNYVLFSQLVKSSSQIGQCYQVSSPNNKDDSALVATDGGLVRVSEARGISHLESIGSSLLVFAENGLWQILGGADFGFAADNYQVVKVTERGCVSPRSVVNLGSQVMYWSEDGIYMTETTDQGIAVAKDVTRNTIKTLYDSIVDKTTAVGTYDKFESSVKWLHGGSQELVYRVNTSSWSRNVIGGDNILKDYVVVQPYTRSTIDTPIVVGDLQVVAATQEVKVTREDRLSSVSSTKYLYITEGYYSFSSFSGVDFRDWGAFDARGLIKGANLVAGDGSKTKQSPYITFHLYKTEDGFGEDLEPTGQSSCIVQPIWDWADNGISGKFGREFQAYRFRRKFMPTSSSDKFENGYQTVVTKNKVRGSGKALSVNIRTEPFKDLHLIGYEQELTAQQL